MSEFAKCSIRQAPLRWFVQAVTVGFLSTFALQLILGGFHLRRAAIGGVIGAVFALVMWAGFELSSPWVRRGAKRSLLLAQFRWLLLYTALYAVCVGIVRLLLGLNLLGRPTSGAISFLMGYAISSSIVGYYTAKDLAQAEGALEKARGEAKILLLKAQLSPHTLFNALNTIAALIPGEPASAEAAVEHLSRFLRRMLEALEREDWSLREEFELIEALLQVERARFGQRLTVLLELPEAEAERRLPPLLLLPLVENSLKHGFRPKVGSCTLRISAGPGWIRVEDDGVGRGATPGTGVGLEAVRSRLAAVGGVLLWPETATGCRVEVRLCP